MTVEEFKVWLSLPTKEEKREYRKTLHRKYTLQSIANPRNKRRRR